jgi:hypothetical protein
MVKGSARIAAETGGVSQRLEGLSAMFASFRWVHAAIIPGFPTGNKLNPAQLALYIRYIMRRNAINANVYAPFQGWAGGSRPTCVIFGFHLVQRDARGLCMKPAIGGRNGIPSTQGGGAFSYLRKRGGGWGTIGGFIPASVPTFCGGESTPLLLACPCL